MIILKNAGIMQFQPSRVEHNMDIVIDGTTIKDIGSNIAANYSADKVIDLNGNLVSPGIVCSHNHFYSGLARGIIANIKPSFNFYSVLQNLWWRLDRAIDEEILYYSGLICSLDAIKSGCTAVIDHHASPSFIKGSLSVLKKGFEKAGLRGITCYEVTERNRQLDEAKEGVEENIAFAKIIEQEKQQKGENRLVEAMIGGHAPFTISDQGLKMMGEAVQETQRGVHIHVAEDKYDVSHCNGVHRVDIIERLRQFGLMNDKAVIVHGVHLLENDINIVNESDAFLVANARSNMNNNVGYNFSLDKIKNLALGTDGIGADMFEEFKFAYFKHKDVGGPMWPDSYVNFLYNGNVLLERYFNEKFGRIEPGYKADLTILDYQSPTPLVNDNIGGHIAFGMSSTDVKTVIVNGSIVYEDRQFPFDVSSIYIEAQKAAQRLWENMDKIGEVGSWQ